MKKVITCFVLLAASLYYVQGSEYVSFSHKSNGTNPISVPENEIWQLITYGSNKTWFEIFSSTNQIPENLIGMLDYNSNPILNPTSEINEKNGSINVTIIGPAYIYNRLPYASETALNQYYIVFKKLQTNANLNSLSVVIPSSASGDVDIILEQSQDGITWTQCSPGTYNSSTVKRFFRLRAVEK